jgi:serine/threonine protein kinase
MTNESKDEIDLSKETVDLTGKDPKEPKSSSGSGAIPILEAGSDFAGYKIIRKIAHGAMGVVYLAEDTKLRRKVALKVILTVPGMQATDDQVDRFLREARSIAKLRHKRIVPVYEVNSFENCHYFTMEYIEGPTLEQYLVKNDVTAAKAIEIILAIAEGLQEAHEKNIVHRDIKPANILMENGESPMITDFGLAKILEHEQKLTMTGTMLGTPCYMSPEQARGDADLDYRSDIFSLGVVLYEMVTEKLPFKGESYMKTILKVIQGDYVAPRKIKPRLSRDVESIIKKSLEKDRDFRYENMVDFIDDCTRFQRGEVVTISRSGIYRKVYRNILKQKSSIIMSVLIALIIGFLMYRNFDQSQTMNEQLQDREEAALAKLKASKEKEQISKEKKQLELQGELLKKGTTSPEFSDRFDNDKDFALNWFASWQPVIVKKGTAEIPASKNLVVTPKAEGYSSSAIFSWKMKMPVGNKFVFFCGKPIAPELKSIEKPIFILFQLTKNSQVNDGRPEKEGRRKLRVLFYQSTVKPIADRTSINVVEPMNLLNPIAVKVFDLPDSIGESLNFSVKRHETFYEIGVKEKEGVIADNDKTFHETIKISSASFLNPSSLQCGFFIPESNKFSMDLEKFRVDKWITGTSEIEINRIVESNWRLGFKELYANLQRHQMQLKIAIDSSEIQTEAINLKYQLAKTTFLMAVINHRILTNQTSKEDLKLISDNYEKALSLTQEYILSHEESNKTEYVNYKDLYLAVSTQLSYFYISQSDLIKAGELIKAQQEISKELTPYNNWLWFLPEPLEKLLSQNKGAPKPKYAEKLNDLFNFLHQFAFIPEPSETSDLKRFLKDLTKNCADLNDFELFDKYNSLTLDDSNKAFLQDIITKEVVKDISKEKINSLLVLSTLKTVNKTFKIDEAPFVGNYKYEKWSTIYLEKELPTWLEHLEFLKSNPVTNRALKAFPEFTTAMSLAQEQGVEAFNGLVENEAFRKKVLMSLSDDVLNENIKKTHGEIQALGEVFPINLTFDQNRGGNINLTLEEDGIKIRIITNDIELKNKFSGNMISQQDCWELYFDFRQGRQFMSSQDGAGQFKISYVPVPGENDKIRIYSQDNSIASKFKIINFNTDRFLQRNEVVLLLPFSEIYHITNGYGIKYFGFNAVLNLESKEKCNLKILFPSINKKIFYLVKLPSNISVEPLITDKDLIDEFVNGYQQYGDSYQDKLKIKRVIDNWLNISPLKPLASDLQIKIVADTFLASLSENSKRYQLKKAIDDANVFFSTSGFLAAVSGQSQWKEAFGKNVVGILISGLDLNLSQIDKKNKLPTALDGESFWEEVKRARALLKYGDGTNRKNFGRFLEKFLIYLKENQPEVYENVHAVLIQVPDAESNYREKAICFMVRGMISESLFYLKKHLESDLWKDDERVWFEYQVVLKLANTIGVDIKISEEDLKEKLTYFGPQVKGLEIDCALVLDKRMKPKEFAAKYPLDPVNLLLAAIAMDTNAKKQEEIQLAYEAANKTVTAPWLSALLKKRIADLRK